MKTAKSGIQGEGDYEATRRYRKRTEAFIAKNDVGKIARQAAPHSKAEAKELVDAEATGRARAKTKSKPAAARAPGRR
jgi:histone H3/H4